MTIRKDGTSRGAMGIWITSAVPGISSSSKGSGREPNALELETGHGTDKITYMSLEQKLTADIGTAMKAKEALRLSALRMLKAALMNKSVEKSRALEAGEELQVVSSLVKQRRDSIEQFTAGGRMDLADKERAEIVVLEGYLPPAVAREEIEQAVAAGDCRNRRLGPKDIGKVMKAVMAALPGKTVDGKAVNEAVRARLA